MKKGKALSLYKKHHVDNCDERLGQFLLLTEKFTIKNALYSGSFVHITPSFVIPNVVYVDTNKQAREFFNDISVYEFVSKKKMYDEDSIITFHSKDYRKDIGEPTESFDLLISQYAGFVSQHCKKYLKIGGILLVNNSHGDASMASIDIDYKFVGVMNKRQNKFSFSEKNLESYFIPKKPRKVTREYLEKIKRGIGYTKSPTVYVFKKGDKREISGAYSSCPQFKSPRLHHAEQEIVTFVSMKI
ncbi:MAG: hypothetical protein IAX21_03760 [Candidatus Bathyarchaeota archaeon]|nr:MAG: hypothetical protein IAX21_03760 [Candidatus Bathyarchaeota archaeon]